MVDQHSVTCMRASEPWEHHVVVLESGMAEQRCAGLSSESVEDKTANIDRLIGQRRVSDAFFAAVRRFADKPALITRTSSFRYGELGLHALFVAHHLLADHRYRPGDRVGVMLSNGPEFVAAYYGILAAGGVVVPLPANIEWCRLERIARLCSARIVITSRMIANRRAEIAPERCSNLTCDASRELDLPEAKPFAMAGQSLAMIMFTSGSSGEPKGVMLSDRNLLANTESILRYLPIAEDDRALALLPFYHAFGHSILQTHLLSGATLVVDGSMAFPNTVIDALERHGVTSFSAVPEGYYSLLAMSDLGERPLPNLRYMAVAGGALKPDSVVEMAQRIAPAKFYVMYGQTEASARLAYLPPHLTQTHPDSIGKAIPGVQLRVFDEQGQGVEPHETGELCARGANVMLGYWNDAEGTGHVIRDGWLRTGDLASQDEEGLFYVEARKNELVKIQGFRVHPREIEDVISRHFPGVRVVVVPYQQDDTIRLALYGITNNIRHRLGDDLRRVCNRELPRHKIPSFVTTLSQTPLNASMKLDRAALKRYAELYSSLPAEKYTQCRPPRRLPA